MSTRVLITGAAGFIGLHVAAACRRRGWTVLGTDRRERAEAAVDAWWVHESVPGAALPAALAGERIDVCIHLAWPVDPRDYLTTPANVTALSCALEIVQALTASGCRQFVMAGTCAEYASHGETITEASPVAAETLYASCKQATHEVARALCRQSQSRLAWGRVFHLYGPGEHPARLLPSMARTLGSGGEFAAGSGRHVRDYLRVEDVGEAFAVLAASESADGAFNICSGRATRIADLMRIFARAIGGEARLRLGAKPDRTWEPESIVGNPERLRALGWTERFGLEEGVTEYARRLAKSEEPISA